MKVKTKLGTLINGDCLQELVDIFKTAKEKDKADMIFTDPPYGIAYTGRSLTRDHDKDSIIGDKTAEEATRLMDFFLPIFKLVSKEDSEWYMFASGFTVNEALLHVWTKLSEYAKVNNLIIWDKKNIGFGQDWRNQYETIFQVKNGKGLPTKATSSGNVISLPNSKTHADDHPMAKPLTLMIKLLSIKKPKFVIDPFCGSGVIPVACERLGIKWLGIEIDKDYFKIAKRNILEEAEQSKLF